MTTRTQSNDNTDKEAKRRRAPKSFTKGRVRLRFTVPIAVKELLEQLADQASMSVPQLTGILIEQGWQQLQEEALKKNSQKTVSGGRSDWHAKQSGKGHPVTNRKNDNPDRLISELFTRQKPNVKKKSAN